MATKTYNTIFKLRRANAADWQPNYILQAGEPGFELDTGKLKIGNGTTPWKDLTYISGTSSGNSGTTGTEEIYVGENPPTEGNPTIWINPNGTSEDLTNIPVYYVEFDMITNDEEEAVSTNDTYETILQEYNLGNTIIAKVRTAANQTMFAPLLEYVISESEPAHHIFRFGAPYNEQFTIISIDDENNCELSTMAFGTNFELGDNMMLDNGVLKARYGQESESIISYCSFLEKEDDADIDIDIESFEEETYNLQYVKLMCYEELTDNNILPSPTTDNLQIKIDYKNGESIINNINFSPMPKNNWLYSLYAQMKGIEDVENLPIELYYYGNETILKLSFTTMKDFPEGLIEITEQELNELNQNPNETAGIYIKMSEGHDSYIQYGFIYPMSYFTEEPIDIQFRGPGKTIYPLPLNALNVGDGLVVDSINNTVDIAYGKETGKKFKSFLQIAYAENLSEDSDKKGNLYQWRVDQWSLSKLQHNEPFDKKFNTFTNDIIINRYKDEEKSQELLSNRRPFSKDNAKRYTIPLFIGDSDIIDDGKINKIPSDWPSIELRYLDQNSSLYNFFSDYFSVEESWKEDYNIIFCNTYNTQESPEEILNNLSLTPEQSNKPGFLFIFLMTYDYNYFFIFSNTNDQFFSYHNTLLNGKFISLKKQLPPYFLSKEESQGSENSIILGNNCEGYDDSEGQIILGYNNKNRQSSPQLILGQYCNPNSNAYLQVGNGNNKNIFEVDSSNVRIEGNLYINGEEIGNNNNNEVVDYISLGDSHPVTSNAVAQIIEELKNSIEVKTIDDIVLGDSHPVTSNAVANKFNSILIKNNRTQWDTNAPHWISSPRNTTYTVYDKDGVSSIVGSEDYCEVSFDVSSWETNTSFGLSNFYGDLTNGYIYGFNKNNNLIRISPLGSWINGQTAVFDLPEDVETISFIVNNSLGGVTLYYPDYITVEQETINSNTLPKMIRPDDPNAPNGYIGASIITDTTSITVEELGELYNNLADRFNKLVGALINTGYMNATLQS